MPLKWKRSSVKTPEGTVLVTHWAKHDPQELLKALEKGRPVRATPPLSVHDFGHHILTARHFTEPHMWWIHPVALFNSLRKIAQLKSPVVEMPVALVSKPGEYVVVTLWKKNTRSFSEFLRDEKISRELKIAAGMNAVAKLAKLHAIGFCHRHLWATNIVVDKHGNASIIDYTLLKSLSQGWLKNDKRMFHHLAGSIFLPRTYPGLSELEETKADRNSLAQRFRQHYDTQYAKYRKRVASRSMLARLIHFLGK